MCEFFTTLATDYPPINHAGHKYQSGTIKNHEKRGGVEMEKSEFDKICKLLNNGASLKVRRQSTGNLRIKLCYCPFKLFSSRYETTDQGLEYLKSLLKSYGHAAA
jgi:hypothetical protein